MFIFADSSAQLLPHEHLPNPVVHPHVLPVPHVRGRGRMRAPRFHPPPPPLRAVAPVTGPHTVASSHPHPASGFPFLHPPPPPPPLTASQGGHDMQHGRLLSHNHTLITSRRPILHPPPCTSV